MPTQAATMTGFSPYTTSVFFFAPNSETSSIDSIRPGFKLQITNCSITNPQTTRHQVLHAARDHQRLRNATERREIETLAPILHRPGGEINVNGVAGNNSLFGRFNLTRKFAAQPLHQLRNLDAKKSIIKRIPQISLREATRDHQRNALGLERRHRLLAAGTGAEVEAADHNISSPRPR